MDLEALIMLLMHQSKVMRGDDLYEYDEPICDEHMIEVLESAVDYLEHMLVNGYE